MFLPVMIVMWAVLTVWNYSEAGWTIQTAVALISMNVFMAASHIKGE